MTITDTETQQVKTSRIPTFQSIQEEAEFWDSHDFTEFEDEFEEVTDVRFIRLAANGRLMLWLEPDEAAALNQRAADLGTYPARLALSWILEHLQVPVEPRADQS